MVLLLKAYSQRGVLRYLNGKLHSTGVHPESRYSLTWRRIYVTFGPSADG